MPQGHHDERLQSRSAGRSTAASRTRRISIVVLFWLLAIAILYVHLIGLPHRLVAGQLVPYNVMAPIDYNYLDREKLSQLSGLNNDEIIAVVNPDFADNALRQLGDFHNDLDNLRRSTAQLDPGNPRSHGLVNTTAERYLLEPQVVVRLLALDAPALEDAMSQASALLLEQMNHQVFRRQLIEELKEDTRETLEDHPENIYVYFLQPNLERKPEALDAARAKARVSVLRGATIARQGDTATDRVLQQLDLIGPKLLEIDFYRLSGLALLLAGGILLWFQYLRRFGARPLLRVGALVQFGTLFCGFLFLGLVVGRLPFSYTPFAVSFAVTALCCLIVMVYDAMFALYFALGLAVVLGLGLHYESDLLIFLMGSALLPPVFLTAGSRRRSQMLLALLLAVFNAALAVAVTLISPIEVNLNGMLTAALAGCSGAIVALGLLPVIETLSSQLTPGKLTEMANAENVL
ncbi:MAG: hypothetical protein M3R04_06595, partial [bacterium]|nr:hypothetical protein [bacterium]